MNQEEYLKNRLEDQINWYDKKSAKNQKLYKRLQFISFIAAAAVPFLSGYISAESKSIQIIVGLLGFITAVITATLSLYKFHENWIEYRATCESLRHEKYLYLAKTSPYNIQDPFPLLVQRVEAVISKENANWTQYISQQKDKQS